MPQNTANSASIDRRRAAVAAYRLRHYSIREIVDALPHGIVDKRDKDDKPLTWHIPEVVNPATGKGYGLGTVERDLEALKEEWLRDASEAFGELKAQHLAGIRQGIRAAWQQNKLYYVFRGLELEAAVLHLTEMDAGEDMAQKLGAFLAGVEAATTGPGGEEVPDLSEDPADDATQAAGYVDPDVPDLSE